MTPVRKQRRYCPRCGFPYRPTKGGKIPKHENVNARVGVLGYDFRFPVCDMSGKQG